MYMYVMITYTYLYIVFKWLFSAENMEVYFPLEN